MICPGNKLLLNSGTYLEDSGDGTWRRSRSHEAFRSFFHASGGGFSISQEPVANAKRRVFDLTDKDAVEALRNGFGSAYTVAELSAGSPGQKKLVVTPAASTMVEGLRFDLLCDKTDASSGEQVAFLQLTDKAAEAIGGAYGDAAKGKVIFRSVGSIIQYLGESHRIRYREGVEDRRGLTYINGWGTEQVLFKADWWLTKAPRAVQVRFHGAEFHVPSMDMRRGETDDRTLKTLAFLDQLIALQTSEASIKGAQPVIAVNQ